MQEYNSRKQGDRSQLLPELTRKLRPSQKKQEAIDRIAPEEALIKKKVQELKETTKIINKHL